MLTNSKSIITAIVFVAFFLFYSNSEAATLDQNGNYWTECSSCSITQKQWAAKQSVPANTEGVYNVYVMDVASETLDKFSVVQFYEPEWRMYFISARSISVEPEKVTAFQAFAQDLKAFEQQASSGIDLPASVANSAYDMIHDSSRRNAIGNYIANNLNFFQALGAYTSIPLVAIKQILNVHVVITVRFEDGSSAIYEVSGLEGSFEEGVQITFQYQPGSAKDADGNNIPETQEEAQQFQGTFSSVDTANAMANFIATWYSLSTGGGVSCSSTVTETEIVITCKKA